MRVWGWPISRSKRTCAVSIFEEDSVAPIMASVALPSPPPSNSSVTVHQSPMTPATVAGVRGSQHCMALVSSRRRSDFYRRTKPSYCVDRISRRSYVFLFSDR